MVTESVFRAEGLVKTYPGVRAVDGVGFSVAPGEIHALLGENGAGKSTLVKTIYGLIRPDEGAMWLNGEPFAPHDPREARARGVGMVFQHFNLFDALSVAENVALGMDNPPPRARLSAEIARLSRDYGLPLDPAAPVANLSAGERQRIEILRALLAHPRLLIMDEPTSVLTPQEAEILFDTLRMLAENGTAILYISHRLDEIRALCDRATVLRHGRHVAELDPRTVPASALAEAMMGAALPPIRRPLRAPGAALLQVQGLHADPQRGSGGRLIDAGFTLNAGEVLGIGGVAGNGQQALMAALSGEVASLPGSVVLDGLDLSSVGPEERRAAGLLSAPEDRLGHAAVPSMSLWENALLTGAGRQKLAPNGQISRSAARGFARRVIEAFDVRGPGSGAEAPAAALSGGNLQKFLIGREVMGAPRVLVVNQPCWGVDAGAAAAIRQSLLDLAATGAGVVVISQDLEELLMLSDRFCALSDGGMCAARPAQGLTLTEIGLMLGGAHGMEVAHVPA